MNIWDKIMVQKTNTEPIRKSPSARKNCFYLPIHTISINNKIINISSKEQRGTT